MRFSCTSICVSVGFDLAHNCGRRYRSIVVGEHVYDVHIMPASRDQNILLDIVANQRIRAGLIAPPPTREEVRDLGRRTTACRSTSAAAQFST